MPLKDPDKRKAYVAAYQKKRLAKARAGDPSLAKWTEQRRAATKRWYNKNRDEMRVRRKAAREANIEARRVKEREDYRKNHAAIRERAKAGFQRNKDRVQQKRRALYASDIQFRIAYTLRNRLRMAFSRGYKNGSAVRDLGCSIAELMEHLKGRFRAGMSFENYGEWHIDHIRPLASFDLRDPDQVKAACHFSNLQPLWAAENIRKGARIAVAEKPPYTEVAHKSEQRLTEARTDSAMTGFIVMETSPHVRTIASCSS